MSTQHRPMTLLQRVVAWVRQRRVLIVKVVSFASVGVVNSLVDLCLFLLLFKFLTDSLIVANVLSWTVAVTGSYVMNSFITFAAELGRRLRWRSYLGFAAAQILGLVVATATLVFAAKAMPVFYAKLMAIGASFLVNFSMSNFVVFRKRG